VIILSAVENLGYAAGAGIAGALLPLLGSGIIIILLLSIGIFSTVLILPLLFNKFLIVVNVVAIIAVFLVKSGKGVRITRLNYAKLGLLTGVAIWIYNLYIQNSLAVCTAPSSGAFSFISQLSCGATLLVGIPALFADILFSIIWLGIFTFFIEIIH
jgi:hypothetical protein